MSKTLKNWNEAYKQKGIIQSEVLDLVENAVTVFKENGVKKVLDLGFGTGRHTVYLAKNGFDVYGMDISDNGKVITEDRLKKEGLSAELCIADMHDLPYEPDSFDGIIAAYVIEHNTYDGLKKTVSEVERVLRPNGFFATTLISVNDYKNGLGNQIEPGTFINPDDPIESETPHRISTKAEVEEMLSNFEIISVVEKREPSTVTPGKVTCRWNIIVKNNG